VVFVPPGSGRGVNGRQKFQPAQFRSQYLADETGPLPGRDQSPQVFGDIAGQIYIQPFPFHRRPS
jgi:hypothetical protein